MHLLEKFWPANFFPFLSQLSSMKRSFTELTLEEHLECSICHETVRLPVRPTTRCSMRGDCVYRCCLKCFQTHAMQNLPSRMRMRNGSYAFKCLLCHDTTPSRNHHSRMFEVDHYLMRVVDLLEKEVACPFCDTPGFKTQNHLLRHVEADCQKYPQPCSWCGEPTTKEDLPGHVASCQAAVPCKWCGRVPLRKGDATSHGRFCPERIVECHLCEEDVPLTHLDGHLKTHVLSAHDLVDRAATAV